ncbi:hypothetical protein jhhlp_004921 [Lomentospora prolificans]|uniref:Chitin-binding type-3 domain-containing protein n=1 Tax=Lomentospora prolificans TaxID=41688 RepID=A0A2N3N7X5_9PEZI|nr:hypothetical protein jhhlp_004921 [Lomentospora prolificans]
MTESLFRLLLIRRNFSNVAPIEQDPDAPSIKLSQKSTFQEKLATALGAVDPRAETFNAAAGFIRDSDFIKNYNGNELVKSLKRLGVLLDEAGHGNDLPVSSVLQLTQQVFGVPASEVVKKPEFDVLLKDLRDVITAVKFDQSNHALPLEEYVNILRDAELIQDAAERSRDNDALKGKKDTNSPQISSGAKTQSIPEWSPQVAYKVGDQARYNENTYVCIQAHTAIVGWEPPKTPALWVKVTLEEPDHPSTPAGPSNLFAFRKRSLLLPTEASLKSVLAAPEPDGTGSDQEGVAKTAKSLIDRHTRIKAAISELTAIDTIHIKKTVQEPQNGVDIDEGLSVTHSITEQIKHIAQLRTINIDQFRAAAERSGTGAPNPGSPNPSFIAPTAAIPALATDPLTLQDAAGTASAVGLVRQLASSSLGMLGAPAFKPIEARESVPTLAEDAPLSERTQSVLSSLEVNPNTTGLPDVVKTLRTNLSEVETELRSLVPTFETTKVSVISGKTIVSKAPVPSEFSKFVTGIDFGKLVPRIPLIPNFDPRIPHTKGKINTIGVGDLIIVKQQLIGYEGADIAHIENVLKGESKKREHTSTTRSETVVSTEEETTTENSRDLSTTSRFEMSQETASTIKEQFDVKGSLQVTGKYGPAVEFTAKAEGGFSRSKETATKSASKFSQDVTEKASKKVTERILKKQTVTNSSEVVEVNAHGIDNSSGPLNVSGVYQWVNKIYEAQMFNYGVRALFDFMIPEPGAYTIHTMVEAADQAAALVKPTQFPLTPTDITEFNYAFWVKKYEATDVKPPPPDYITVSDGFAKGDMKVENDAYHTARIAIDKGYEAVHARIGQSYSFWKDDQFTDVILGNSCSRIKIGGVITVNLARQRNFIPWAVHTFHVAAVTVTVEITCAVTEDALNEWRADTHAKLTMAYKARLQEYEEKLATIQLQAGITIQGRNPASNAISVKQELKKNCISVITGQYYDAFNSINAGANGPYINLNEAEAEGSYVRFFEQAFEWENMSRLLQFLIRRGYNCLRDRQVYVMYPYFWGRKYLWADKLAIEDTDPEFEEFLKAGFCRVQVPARPGFEPAIDHFLQFGELWNGGPLPAISSPLFLPIADEIAERAQKPGDEVPQGEPWKVRVPTTLVKLRQDDKLPKWTKVGDEWVPNDS